MSILKFENPFPTGLGSTFVTVISASTKLNVDPYHDGQHDDVVVVGELGELEYVVLVDDGIAYLAKLPHLSSSHDVYLMLLFLLARWGVIWF